MDLRVILSALPIAGGLLASCDDRETGSFETQGENLAEWSNANPYVTDQTWAGVKSLKCEATAAKRCGPNDCKTFKSSTFVRWRPAEKKYERCGGNQLCDVYDAQVAYSGAWANIAVPENGLMARMTASGQFVEVLTQMDAVLVYHGQCQAEGQGAG